MGENGIIDEYEYFEQLISINQYKQKKIKKSIKKILSFQETINLLSFKIIIFYKLIFSIREKFLFSKSFNILAEKMNNDICLIMNLFDEHLLVFEDSQEEKLNYLVEKLSSLEEREKIFKSELIKISDKEFLNDKKKKNRAIIKEIKYR